jgi:CTP:molybdopterin cytidylyltransferase MocA
LVCQGSLVYQGSPCIFSAAFRDELLSLSEGEKPRIIKARHPEAVITVEAANPFVLVDIDEPGEMVL